MMLPGSKEDASRAHGNPPVPRASLRLRIFGSSVERAYFLTMKRFEAFEKA